MSDGVYIGLRRLPVRLAPPLLGVASFFGIFFGIFFTSGLFVALTAPGCVVRSFGLNDNNARV